MSRTHASTATFVVATLLLVSAINAQTEENWDGTRVIAKHVATAGYGKGMMCDAHPLKKRYNWVSGEILRSWHFALKKKGNQQWFKSGYMPRHNLKLYGVNAPYTKYDDLDILGVYTGKDVTEKWVTIEYQREAKTFLYVSSWDTPTGSPSLSGWNPEGYVKAPDSVGRQPFVAGGVGAHTAAFNVMKRGFMFSKVGETVTVPTRQWIARNIRGLKTDGYYNILIAEHDGSPTKEPKKPWQFRDVKPGSLCPESLHRWFRVKGRDSKDWQTRNRLFHTWHPLWDPCFWCTYGHEHGSSAPMIMDYYPRYGYTALKNFNQNEAHMGFKDYVFDFPKYLIYYGVHAHVSDYGRFDRRFHTNVIVARNKKTWEIELELHFKADYGALIVRDAARRKVGVTPKMAALHKQLGLPRRMRIVNVLNEHNVDKRWLYRRRDILLHGLYEQWATAPICTKTTPYLEPTTDIKDPVTAMKTAAFPSCGAKCNTQILGTGRGNEFKPSASVDREFRVTDMLFDIKECKFEGSRKMPANGGYFYTNPYGTVVEAGPGRNNIRQYVKDGFWYKVSGHYNTVDTWQGLYQKDTFGHFQNVGYGINEMWN